MKIIMNGSVPLTSCGTNGRAPATASVYRGPVGVGQRQQRRGFRGGLGQVFPPRPAAVCGDDGDGLVVHPAPQQLLDGIDHVSAGR
uniref:hypothetical protein n=1 Tax=Mycobacterium pinniadriaticum TaxID=2994102 RepID=UPI00389966E8